MSRHSRIARRRYLPQLLRTGLVGTAFVLIGIGTMILYRQTGGLDVVKVTGLVDRMTTSAYAPQAAPDFAGAGAVARSSLFADSTIFTGPGVHLSTLKFLLPFLNNRSHASRDSTRTRTSSHSPSASHRFSTHNRRLFML